MPDPTTERGTAQAHIELQRARVLAAVERQPPAVSPGFEPLPPRSLDHLRRDAEELYWNELTWEELTDEEAIAGGHLTELVFSAFLAFVDGLLIDPDDPDAADAGASAPPHPDAVEEILTFLGERYAAFTADLEGGIDSGKVVWARAMTLHLVDLVLYRRYGLSRDEREEVERAG